MTKKLYLVTMIPFYQEFTIEGDTINDLDDKEDQLADDLLYGDIKLDHTKWVQAKGFKDCNMAFDSIYEQRFYKVDPDYIAGKP